MNDSDEMLPMERDALDYDYRLLRNRDTFDSQKLIRDILATPSDEGPTVDVSTSGMSFSKLTKQNLDVQTRIIMKMAYQASSGDVKSAEFLFKYAGLEPPKEQTLTVKTPTFIDDIEFTVQDDDDDEDDFDDDDEDEEDDDKVVMLPAGVYGEPHLIEPKEKI